MQRAAKPGGQAAIYRVVIIVGAIILLAAVVYFYYARDEQVEAPPPTAAVQPQPATPTEPEPTPLVRHPLPEEKPDAAGNDAIAKIVPKPLPELGASDDMMTRLSQHFLDKPELVELLVPKDLLRRIVITVDNLPRRAIPQKMSPFAPPSGTFMVTGREASLTIDPKNYARYDRYVALIEQLDSAELITAYLRVYPLLQAAYDELGYPNVYFNDRVMLAIDDMLATPDLSDPPQLIQPQVYYQYQRPELESLSAGQKLLLRMGPERAAALKTKLTEIREELRKR